MHLCSPKGPEASPGASGAMSSGGLSDAEKIALERLKETGAQLEQELEARFSATTAEAVQAMEGQIESCQHRVRRPPWRGPASGRRSCASRPKRQASSARASSRPARRYKPRPLPLRTQPEPRSRRRIAKLTTQADERAERMREQISEANQQLDTRRHGPSSPDRSGSGHGPDHHR